MKRSIAIGTIALCLCAAAINFAYQKPRLSLNAQQFGFMLLRGGYRSYFLCFSDGQMADDTGRLRSVVMDVPSGKIRFGYRLPPKFIHTDMRKLHLR